MHTPRLLLALLSGAFASLIVAPVGFAQGALTPPGAPAPMFKTLDQIEARKPLGTPNIVTTSTIVIDQPGSYVLVGPVTVSSGDGITINTGNVTLDLNGFTISSTASPRAGSGVAVPSNSHREIVVRNGVIAGGGGLNQITPVPDPTGFIHGVTLGTTSPFQFLCLNGYVQAVRVGAVTGYGILAEHVENCGVRVGLSAGIYGGFISDSTVYVSNPVGIDATASVRDSHAQNANGTVGIRAPLVDGCHVYSRSGVGIRANLVTHSLVNTSVVAQGIEAQAAVGSLVITSSSTIPTGAITNKYDMP